VNLAAREIREAFSPIATNVSGIEICEHLPAMAPKTIIHDRRNRPYKIAPEGEPIPQILT